ncbi:glutamate-1-semialdehyde 2,1-aminomutase, partial [Nocardia sp. NPDC058497]
NKNQLPETASLAAFRAVVHAYRTEDPITRMEQAGRELADGVNAVADALGIAEYLQVRGRPSCLIFRTLDPEGAPSQAFRTLFLQELLEHGVLGQSFVTSAAHDADAIAATITACAAAAEVYRRAIERGTVDGLLRGRPVAPALRRTAAPRQIEVSTDR